MSSRKRRLLFNSANDVREEIEKLQRQDYRKLKNWNLSQICEHLTKTMQGEMDGLGFRLPWILRKTVGSWLTAWVLRTQSMPSVPTLPSLKPIHQFESDNDETIRKCIDTLQTVEAFDGSLREYPFVDGITHEQWRQFMWIHAAHHLGFLHPLSNG